MLQLSLLIINFLTNLILQTFFHHKMEIFSRYYGDNLNYGIEKKCLHSFTSLVLCQMRSKEICLERMKAIYFERVSWKKLFSMPHDHWDWERFVNENLYRHAHKKSEHALFLAYVGSLTLSSPTGELLSSSYFALSKNDAIFVMYFFSSAIYNEFLCWCQGKNWQGMRI